MKQIEITHQLSFKALLKLAYYRHYKSKFIIYAHFMGVALLLSIANIYFGVVPADDTMLMPMSTLAFILFTFIPFQVYAETHQAYSWDEALQKKITYQFSSEGLTVYSGLDKQFWKWEDIQKIEFLDEWLIIHVAAFEAIHLHKNHIEGISWEELKAFLKQTDFRGSNSF